MKQLHTLLFFISCVLLVSTSAIAQVETETKVKDSIKYTEHYGLRIGGDLGKLVRSFIDDDYSGFEINADYRLSRRLYIAGEIGFEEKTTATEFLNSTAKGSYFKGGIDYNMYQNWFGMENMIYSGFRVGASTFTQTLNNFTTFNSSQFWEEQFSSTDEIEFDGLSAIWAELILGIKAEVFNNLYVGLNVQVKGRLSEREPDNFENIYIPGFGRTYDSGRIGVGVSYNISYLIPLYKKNK
jgi:hypothetical protein